MKILKQSFKISHISFLTIILYFYYSVKDLLIPFGKTILYNPLIDKNIKTINTKKISKIHSRRAIKGKLIFDHYSETYSSVVKCVVSLQDLYGLDSSGLKNLILSSGLSIQQKESLDDYKSHMDEAVVKKTELFLEYAMNDAVILLKIVDAKLFSFNSILTDIYGINDSKYYFTLSKFAFNSWYDCI